MLHHSTTNFLLVGLADNLSADTVCARLARDKILVRNCSNFIGLSKQFIRISLKQPDHNRMLAQKMLAMAQPGTKQKQKKITSMGHRG
jgi:threonine-phosphate decarboxylase